MIATNIDGTTGSGDANQVFNLLAVVANPDMYAEKVRTLLEATAEHKKFLALVAPANEILAIRQQIDQDRAEAAAKLDKARADAAQLVAAAKADAQSIVDAAKEQGAKTTAAAKKVEKQAADKMTAAAETERKAADALAEATALQKTLDDRIKATDVLRAEVEKLKAEHEAIKAALIAKHKRHLQELEA